MGDALNIRLADTRDVGELSALGSQVFRKTYGHTAPPDHVEKHIERHFAADAIVAAMRIPDVEYYIALAGEVCAGLLKLRGSAAPRQLTEATSAVEVQQLYVAPDQQRLGVGARLMDRAVDVARGRCVEGIWLSVWSEASWATGFYRRYGFVELGTEPFCMGGTEHVDYVMWLPCE